MVVSRSASSGGRLGAPGLRGDLGLEGAYLASHFRGYGGRVQRRSQQRQYRFDRIPALQDL